MSSVKLSLVAAACDGMGIGKNGSLPWQLRKEMAFFKKLTTECPRGKRNAVIMGKNTWLSIPPKLRPLANRLNIVISTTLPACDDGSYVVVRSFDAAVNACADTKDLERVFVIGGCKVYDDALSSPSLSRVYLTRIHAVYDCDTFFPNFNADAFRKIQCSDIPTEVQEEDGVRYTYEIYEK